MVRLILSSPVEPADRHQILTDLDLELWNGEEEVPGQAYFEPWFPFDLNDRTVIRYLDDVPIGVRYFTVRGDESWVQRIRQSFPIMTRDAVFERARAASNDSERIEATYMIALVGGHEPEETALAELKASLHHPSEEVRFAAILATGYTTWPAPEEDLAELAAKDESPRVRDRAQRMLQAVAEHGWEEQA